MPPFNVWDQSTGGDTWESSAGVYRSELQDYARKLAERLHSPEEFDRMPAGIKNLYGGYGGYLKRFQMMQKAQGNPEYADSIALKSIPVPTSGGGGRIPSASGGAAIPKPRIHRGLGGEATMELGGGGIRRGLGGRQIAETPEQIAQAGALQRDVQFAIPEQEMLTADEAQKIALAPERRETTRATTEAAKYGAQATEELAEYAGKQPVEERYGRTKDVLAEERVKQGAQRVAQGSERIGIARDALKAKVQDWKDKYGQQVAMEQLRQEGRKELLAVRDKLDDEDDELNRKWLLTMERLRGNIPGTREQAQKFNLEIDKAVRMLQEADTIARGKEARQALRDSANKLLQWQETVAREIMDNDPKVAEEEQARVGRPIIRPPQPAPAPARESPRSSAGTGPQIGEIRNGYEYRGGNPNDRNSWVKI